MKNVFVFTLVLCFLYITSLFHSCNVKEVNPKSEISKDSEKSEGEVVLKTPFYFEDGVALPEGTILKPAIDQEGKPYIKFVLPEGYKLIGVTANSRTPAVFADGSITCECSKGTGCSPFSASGPGGTVEGCALGSGCTECKASRSAFLRGTKVLLKESDIINTKAGISLVINAKDLTEMKTPIASMFDLSFAQKDLLNFAETHQFNQIEKARNAKIVSDLPVGYKMMPVNMYDRIVLLPLEYDRIKLDGSISMFFMDKAVSEFIEMEDSGASCKCTSGSFGCALKTKSVIIGSATWCEAGSCTSCTLKN